MRIPSSAILLSLHFSLCVVVCCVPLCAAAPNSDADIPREPLPEKLVPTRPRSEEEQDRVTAATWFAQGRILEQREEYAAALRCFQRAWRWDPRGASPLQEIVPLAFELKRQDEAARYAVIAASKTKLDPILLRRLAIVLTEDREWTRAAALYEGALAQQAGGGEKIEDLGGALICFELGRLYFLAGDFQKSSASFARVRDLLLDPTVPLGAQATKTVLGKPEETWQLVAESFLAAGRHDEAAALFVKADEASPDKPQLALRLARVEAAKKNRDGAIKKLDEYFASKSIVGGTEPYGLLSKLLTEGAADLKVARAAVLKRLQELQQADEKNSTLRFYRAEELLDAGDLTEAEKLYGEALADRPRSEVRQRLVELYLRQKNAQKLLEATGPLVSRSVSLDSLREVSQAIAGDAELLGKIIMTARNLLKEPADKRPQGAILVAGLLALEGKKYDEAEEFFTAQSAEIAEKKGEVLFAWGLGLLGDDQHARAAKVLQKIADEKLLPERAAQVHYFLAGALAMAKEDARAFQAAKRAVEIDPANPLYESRLAWVYYHASDLPNARRSYQDLLAKLGDNFKNSAIREVVHDTRLALSNVALKQGDFAAAVESLEQVLDEFPEDAGALNDLGYLWIERGLHLKRGVSMAERAVAVEPANPSYRDSLGWGYYQLGLYSDAVRELTLAAGKDPGGVILDHLGDAHQKAGDGAKARAAWQKAAAAFEKDGEKEKLEAVRGKLK
ncbi:MAG: tetratricopeptide repeat protein [Planctomycetales bacterium]|nr:tetratricopeptide repeat protein [Planctomycetales bacterium]